MKRMALGKGTSKSNDIGGTGTAFRNACEALDLHLESLQKLHLPLPKPRHRLVVQV